MEAQLRFQCRTRLCGWCNWGRQHRDGKETLGFNAARGFVGGAASNVKSLTFVERVSMPHAALWVVQLKRNYYREALNFRFNAARGFVGGAASSLAALVPLGRKSPFGKSPEIRAF